MVDAGGAPVDQAWLGSGEWSVQIGDRIVPARVSLRPRYDPAGQRIRM
jgi:4-methylaminobutanoate oxidase (formaldehyde-forming)